MHWHNEWDTNTKCTHWGGVCLKATVSCSHQGQLTLPIVRYMKTDTRALWCRSMKIKLTSLFNFWATTVLHNSTIWWCNYQTVCRLWLKPLRIRAGLVLIFPLTCTGKHRDTKIRVLFMNVLKRQNVTKLNLLKTTFPLQGQQLKIKLWKSGCSFVLNLALYFQNMFP